MCQTNHKTPALQRNRLIRKAKEHRASQRSHVKNTENIAFSLRTSQANKNDPRTLRIYLHMR